jgi:hypothetical protein
MLLLLSVPHDAAAGPVHVGAVADAIGDNVSGPDIVFAGIVIDDSWVTFTMQFATGTLDPATTKSSFTLDTDQDSATGVSWNGLGAEVLISQGYAGDTGTARLTPLVGGFTAASSPVSFLADRIEYSFARSLFGAEDGALDFIASVQIALDVNAASTIRDFAPDINRGAGPASTTISVPEPSTFAMLTGGLSLLSAYRRRGGRRIPRE